MISDKMKTLVKTSSAIRAMFEEGKRLADIYGADNVYDFSLGNPSVEPPTEIKDAIIDILNEEDPGMIHGYMNNSGYEDVRESIALSINKKYDTDFSAANIVMSVGAAGGLNVILKCLINPDDEVITFAPYFGEYRNYVSNYDGVLVTVKPNTENFQPNLKEFEEKITGRTKAVIINSPNNPTGVVYSEETIIRLADILNKKRMNIIRLFILYRTSLIENWHTIMLMFRILQNIIRILLSDIHSVSLCLFRGNVSDILSFLMRQMITKI